MLETLSWTGQSLRLLDQTKLPTRTEYVEISTEQEMWDAIKRLVVRGAPAIGVSAAFGAYLGVRNFTGEPQALMLRLSEVCDYLATSRPTAVNLFWALKRVQRAALAASDLSTAEIKQRILNEALAMLEEDKQTCRAIGQHGAELLRSLDFDELPSGLSLRVEDSRVAPSRPLNILTHCNAGSLATVAYGTALAPIYVGIEQGMRFHVYADETRPLLQGSRITAYELRANNVPVTVLCDNMAAALMGDAKNRPDAIIVGADRVAANGDVANKIGTLGVAILAKHFGVPFFVASPISTIDFSARSGRDIPIEHRDGREVSHAFGSQTAPEDAGIFNPAFDVTPADLVTAIITERGVVRAPYDQTLANLCADR